MQRVKGVKSELGDAQCLYRRVRGCDYSSCALSGKLSFFCLNLSKNRIVQKNDNLPDRPHWGY